VPGRRRTRRDWRRRRLGQNFLCAEAAERFVRNADFSPGELVVEIGPGSGALTLPLARRGADLVAVELDRVWAERLRARLRQEGLANVRVVSADFRSFDRPKTPFRVVGNLPFHRTNEMLGLLLDDPRPPLRRADLIVQWGVAKKRTVHPPETLRSTAWAPWWTFHRGPRIPARAFRPAPTVDAGVLTIVRREPALLPEAMAGDYARFLRERWPFRRER
jgi:23S rRNA (adenine-N6)-dimethyltransferase